MQYFGAAVYGIFLAIGLAATASAECACTVTMGPPIVFSEDPLIFADENVEYHAVVEDIYFDGKQCLVLINYPDGVTGTYTEATGYEAHKLKLAPLMAAHQAFAGYGAELTLSEVSHGAAEFCSPSGESGS